MRPTLSPSTLSTSTLSPTAATSDYVAPSEVTQNDWNSSSPSSLNPSTNIVINITDGGSTGRGIVIGILSAFGSAGIAVLVLAIFFFFRYTNRGRILLDRIGRPGEFDDEQAFAREEAEALESMDDLQRLEYMRAKGTCISTWDAPFLTFCNSIRASQPARDCPYRHFIVAIPCDSRKGSFCLGV